MSKEFKFVTKRNNEVVINCEVYETRQSWGHRCKVYIDGQYWDSYKIRYYNRTWERFEFESLLDKAIHAIYGQGYDAKFLEDQVDMIAKKTREECDAWFNTFKKSYDALSDTTKNHLANANIEITSKEQADAVMKTSQAFDVLFRLEEGSL